MGHRRTLTAPGSQRMLALPAAPQPDTIPQHTILSSAASSCASASRAAIGIVQGSPANSGIGSPRHSASASSSRASATAGWPSARSVWACPGQRLEAQHIHLVVVDPEQIPGVPGCPASGPARAPGGQVRAVGAAARHRPVPRPSPRPAARLATTDRSAGPLGRHGGPPPPGSPAACAATAGPGRPAGRPGPPERHPAPRNAGGCHWSSSGANSAGSARATAHWRALTRTTCSSPSARPRSRN
jgi:hypothetical protein